MRLVPAAVALICAACQSASTPTPTTVVAAERAFAKDGYDLGFKASFLKHSADDAIVLTPGPINAHESLSAQPDDKPDDPKLVWWPLYAGIARSGDLGFTTGPFEFAGKRQGHYFTVWKKQPDGGWKWVFDAGVGADPSAEASKDSDVAYLPTSSEVSASAEKALSEVDALEDQIASRAGENVATAFDDVLDPDSRLHSKGPPPAKSAEARPAVFAARPQKAALKRLGGSASDAGDLVWTYGEARWSESGAEKVGYYARIWQKRKHGWRLVFDELVPAPPSP